MSRMTGECRIREIELSQIDRSRNHRIPMAGDAERVEALKSSIESCGQLQPVRVYERGEDQRASKKDLPYILGFGSRRCAAMELLGRPTIRAVVFPPATDAEIAQARAVENLHRQDITPLEEVLAVADILTAIKADPTFTGDAYDEAATQLARSVAWVKDRDYLHRLTKPVQRFAMRAGLPAGHLRELAKVGDPHEQMRLACECAGAPAWCFPAKAGDAKIADHANDVQESYFAELADGKVTRWPLSRLKEQVAKVQFSLRVIPWEFGEPVAHNGQKYRKCAGCPHNSESDRTLFGIDEDPDNPRGFCLNAACYNGKQKACGEAKQQVFVKISKRSVQTPDAIRKAAPDWLKESSVIGYVKRQLEKAKVQGDNATTGEDSERSSSRDHRRPLTDHEQRLIAYGDQMETWQSAAYAAVLEAVNTDPVRRIGWLVLHGVGVFAGHPRIQSPHVNRYGDSTTEEPVIPTIGIEVR
ncbi:MAG: ParB N-terminal domain-containing protein, partial [Burkholderiales bacterium]|nr:ParB N-terminal domain-containing protein [Phycisphaerae bacterium]